MYFLVRNIRGQLHELLIVDGEQQMWSGILDERTRTELAEKLVDAAMQLIEGVPEQKEG